MSTFIVVIDGSSFSVAKIMTKTRIGINAYLLLNLNLNHQKSHALNQDPNLETVTEKIKKR